MRLVFGLVLILGVGLAGFAVYMAQGFVGNKEAEVDRLRAALEARGETVNVYVVTRALKYGEQLQMEDVQKIAWTNDRPAHIHRNSDANDAKISVTGHATPRERVKAQRPDFRQIANPAIRHQPDSAKPWPLNPCK